MATSSHLNPTVGESSLHTAWIFQAIASFPTGLVLGVYTFDALFSGYALSVYIFLTYTFNTLFASAIIFLVVVQWSLINRRVLTPQLTFLMELAKALIATGMWLWLLLDSIFAGTGYKRSQRIVVVAISIILVIVLFYPTAIYAAYARKQDVLEREGAMGADERSEATPLLAGGTRV